MTHPMADIVADAAGKSRGNKMGCPQELPVDCWRSSGVRSMQSSCSNNASASPVRGDPCTSHAWQSHSRPRSKSQRRTGASKGDTYETHATARCCRRHLGLQTDENKAQESHANVRVQ